MRDSIGSNVLLYGVFFFCFVFCSRGAPSQPEAALAPFRPVSHGVGMEMSVIVKTSVMDS